MGFGYLFIGYLLAFVLQMTLSALGWGAVALLVGYGVMLGGLWILTHYQQAFVWAKWALVPMLVTAIYSLLGLPGIFPFLHQSLLQIFLGNCGCRYDPHRTHFCRHFCHRSFQLRHGIF